MSIGVAEILNPATEKSEELIERADRALYRAKATGKNKVVRHSRIEDNKSSKASDFTPIPIASNQ